MVDFYDENILNGAIERTGATVVPRVYRWEGAWRADGTNVLAVKYAVPSGRRGDMRYYGFVVQVFYHDRLQDMVARPASLMKLRRQAVSSAPAGGSGS